MSGEEEEEAHSRFILGIFRTVKKIENLPIVICRMNIHIQFQQDRIINEGGRSGN